MQNIATARDGEDQDNAIEQIDGNIESTVTHGDEDNGDNMLFTMEIKIENDSKFLAKVEKTFHNWDPLYFGRPRGILVNFVKRN